MLSAFANIFKVQELRQRIFFTLGLVVLCRLLAQVPSPGINAQVLEAFIESAVERAGGGMMTFIDMFSGGALGRAAVGALGIMPYISASIIIQLMTAVLPQLERLAREGDSGRQKLTQYTRYLTLAICAVQGFGIAMWLQSGSMPREIVHESMRGLPIILMTILTTTTGTMVMMWLGEQITERGIGNGISIVITVNILSRLPFSMIRLVRQSTGENAQFNLFDLIGMGLIAFLMTAGTVALTQAVRRIPIHTTRRVVGRRSYGGESTYMPLRLNFSGVMPIIFASALLTFPVILLTRVKAGWAEDLVGALQYGQPLYLTVFGAMILFFSFFWVSTQWNPPQIADDLKRNGAYVPGIRPGTPTADFLDHTMTRLTLVGAVALTFIAVLPSVLTKKLNVPQDLAQFMGGTSLLIMVGVMLDTMRQIESHLVMRNYDGFLKKGRVHGRS
jgi:preprotein translocase subunit SecY